MHFCDVIGLNFNKILQVAKGHYEAEVCEAKDIRTSV